MTSMSCKAIVGFSLSYFPSAFFTLCAFTQPEFSRLYPQNGSSNPPLKCVSVIKEWSCAHEKNMPVPQPLPHPLRAINGFACFVSSLSLLAIYLVWSYVPGCWMGEIGLPNWPEKFWTIALPIAICCIVAIFWFIVYPGMCLMITSDLSSIDTITDNKSEPPISQFKGSVVALYDIPVWEVSRQLYEKKNIAQKD